MLDDQNRLVFIPVLNSVDEKEKRLRRLTTVRMNEARRLWQAEIDASSGSYVRYNFVSSDSAQPQTSADQDAATLADLATEMVFSSETEWLPECVRRSLMHRILAGPPKSLDKESKNEENQK